MRLDWNCIREILVATESLEDGNVAAPGMFPGFSEDKVVEHIRLLVEAGFIEGYPKGAAAMFSRRLTWSGHEFLATLRSRDLWSRIKTEAKYRGLELSFELIKVLASKYLGSLVA